MTNQNYKNMLVEVFGESYLQLMEPKKQPQRIFTDQQLKLCVIDDINKARKIMGATPCVDDYFYYLYDLSLDQLRHESMKQQDDAHHFLREQIANNHKLR